MIDHTIDLSKNIKLIKASGVSQFGEGYRSVTGTTIAEGLGQEMLEYVRKLPRHEQLSIYLSDGSGSPRTLAEVEAQIAVGQ